MCLRDVPIEAGCATINRVRARYVAFAALLRHVDEFVLDYAKALLQGLHFDLQILG